MTNEQQLISAIVFLTTCIVVLAAWCRDRYLRLEKIVDSQSTAHKIELEARDRQRNELQARVSKLEVSDALLRRCPYTSCPLRIPKD